jgi:uncharacterized protein (TIGR02246 family)
MLAAAILSVCGCARSGAGAGTSPDAMIAAAKAVDQQFTSAFNRGDIEGLMATYSREADVVLFPPAELEVRGWESIRKDMAQFLASVPGARIELIDPQYRAAGDVVIGWGTWRTITPSPDGRSMETMGRYTDVKAQRDGKWVYIVDHASIPLPPAAPASTSSPPPEEETEPAEPENLDEPEDPDQPEDLDQPDDSDPSDEE